MDPIYLDNAATTPLSSEVAEAMLRCQQQDLLGNPASQHAPGRAARRRIEDAREGIAEMLGASVGGRRPDRVVFTSGGTEANNQALRGLGDPSRPGIITTPVEHSSVAAAADALARSGTPVERLPVDSHGVVQIEQLGDRDLAQVRLASIVLGNNEVGVLQPVAQAAEICRRRGVAVHTDAVQAVGKIPVAFQSLGVDAMTVAAHKFHGPCGIGVLVVRHGVPLAPLLFGGHQQEGLRPGTEPVALAVGMHRALQIWHNEQARQSKQLTALRDRLESGLRRAVPDLIVWGDQVERLPHILGVAIPGVDRQALVMALDMAGVAAATGSACASGSSQPSPTLLAMGVSDDLVRASIRLSISSQNTPEQIDEAVARIAPICSDLRRPDSPGKTPGAANAAAPNPV